MEVHWDEMPCERWGPGECKKFSTGILNCHPSCRSSTGEMPVWVARSSGQCRFRLGRQYFSVKLFGDDEIRGP